MLQSGIIITYSLTSLEATFYLNEHHHTLITGNLSPGGGRRAYNGQDCHNRDHMICIHNSLSVVRFRQKKHWLGLGKDLG